MKITNANIETLAPASTGNTGSVSSVNSNESRTAASANASGSDSVSLSSASQLLNLAKSGSADRSAKVADIAALVRSGQYSTDPSGVSQAVIQGHL